MSIVHICRDMEHSFPKEHVASLESSVEWQGHESEIWVVPKEAIVIDPWTREMCETGCKAYNTTPFCPPHLPDIKNVKSMIESYSAAVLIRYGGFNKWKDSKAPGKAKSLQDFCDEDKAELSQRKKLRFKIREVSNMLVGLGYETFPMSAGHCRICEPPVCTAKECRYPEISMPAIEGMGIHVFKTMEGLGHAMHYPAQDTFSFYNGILINPKNQGNIAQKA